MNQLKLYETVRLHYNTYLYKLVLSNPIIHIFRTDLQRGVPLSFARSQLDDLTQKYRANEPLTKQTFRATVEIPVESYLDAKDIYSILKKNSGYKLRVETSRSLGIYSNDRDMLMRISKKMRESLREFWEPAPGNELILLNKKDIVLVKSPSAYEYKVHLRYTKVDVAFKNWIDANLDKIKIGAATYGDISTGFANGCYFYVRDERVLSLVELLIGHAIRKVDKIVYKGDIDKYKYDN